VTNPYAADPLDTFASGDTDYVDKLNANGGRITAVGSTQDTRISGLEQSSVGGDADAFQNIENLLHNGSFFMTQCGPEAENSAWASTIPVDNGTQELVRWADGWFLECDSGVGDVIVENVDGTFVGVPCLKYALRLRTGGTGLQTGTIYQRVDTWVDRREFRGKSVRFTIAYTAVALDEFLIEVDDGVDVTQSVSTPAGSGQVTIQHACNTAATKLTVKIVFLATAVTNNLQITYAHLRLGVRPVNLIGYTPPPNIAVETARSGMIIRDVLYPTFRGSGPFTATSEIYLERVQFPEPLVTLSGTLADVEFGLYEAYDVLDVLNIGAVAGSIAPVLIQAKRYGVSCNNEPGGDLAADRVWYDALVWSIVRNTALGDPAIAPFSCGFSATTLMFMYRLIPTP